MGIPKTDDWTVGKVCELYLAELPKKVKRSVLGTNHARLTAGYIVNFMEFCGQSKVDDIDDDLLDDWLDANEGWVSPSSKRHALIAAQSAFTYCCNKKKLGINPIKGYTKPQVKSRITSFQPEDEELIYANTDACFSDFIKLGILTGLRSYCELSKITADDLIESERGMQIRVVGKMKAKQREHIRTIPILPEARLICKRLALAAPRGSGLPLLRNAKGEAWKKGTLVMRFFNLRKKLGWDKDPVRVRYSCYTTRGTHAHRMISGQYSLGVKKKGVTLEVLSTLLGNTPKVCFDSYCQFWQEYDNDLLWEAVNG